MHSNISRKFPNSIPILNTHGCKQLKPIVTVKKYGHNWKRDSITRMETIFKAKSKTSFVSCKDKTRSSTSNKSFGKGNKDVKRDNFVKCVKNCLAMTEHSRPKAETGQTAGKPKSN